MRTVLIQTEYIKLDSFLKFCGAAGTGGQAKMMIEQGLVRHGEEICTQRGRKIRPGDVVTVENQSYQVVKDDS